MDNKWKIIIIFLIILAALSIITIIMIQTAVKHKLTKETIILDVNNNCNEIQWVQEENNDSMDIENIIKNNIENEVKEVIETKVVELEYETEYKNNPNLPKGKVQILQQGQDGKQELIIKKGYKKDKLIYDEQIGKKIVEPTIDRIVEVGTSNYYDNYNIKIGDIVYATPYELDIRKEPKKSSKIIIKINQNAKLKIKKKSGNWYYIIYNNYNGWVEADCVTYIVPNNFKYNDNKIEKTKNELFNTISKNMQLNKPSGLTLDQFEKIFADEEKDVNNIFKENAKYFYYIEQAYGINGVFVAAIGIHESAWGTSKIATNKRNLFGYGAYDMNAYASAYEYNGYAAGIDMIARVLMKHYLHPKGTSIYNGEIATGKYYNGNTLSGVNKKYATDKKWVNGIYTWMKYLYNKL